MPPRKSLPNEKAATASTEPTNATESLPAAPPPGPAIARATSVPSENAGPGAHPHSAHKEKVGINIEDLNLPKSIVTRLAKEPLPNGTAIAAQALLGIQKSATVFVNYLASQANEIAQQSGRKTISPQDVLKALEEVGFGEWNIQLQEELNVFEANAKAKREKSKAAKVADGEDGDRPRKKLKGAAGNGEAEAGAGAANDEENVEEEENDNAEEHEEEEVEGEEEEEEEEDVEDDNQEDQDQGEQGLNLKDKDEALDNGEDSD